MFTPSAPLTADHLKTYHRTEFTATQYYSQDGQAVGRWHGKLAAELGLVGAVDEDVFALVADGRHPHTWGQLVEHRKPQPKVPEWVTDDAKWREKLEDLYATAIERGHNPVVSAAAQDMLRSAGMSVQWDAYTVVDATRFMIDHLEQVAPILRHETAVGLAKYLGVDPPEPIEESKHREHRAGWDLTFSAPKSVSLTALVGGDERVTEAHRAAVKRTLDYLEQYIQARVGGNHPPETTARALFATFEHDTARPVDGYPAPQLHTHAILFNLTQRADGSASALQPREIFRIQEMVTWVYRAELMHRLRELGYDLERSKNGAFEISGYSQEYLDAESLRRQGIVRRMEVLGIGGARAAEIVAHQDREEKITLTPDETRALHKAHAEEYGSQPDKVVETARSREKTPAVEGNAEKAVTFSKHHLSEREAVFEHHKLVANALRYGMGHYRVEEVEREIGKRLAAGEIRRVDHVRPHAPGARYATAKMIEMERAVIRAAIGGKERVMPIVEQADLGQFPILANDPTRKTIVRQILASRHQTLILQGAAGAGKTKSVVQASAAIARENGYDVHGLAPVGKAADVLRVAGLPADTLQKYLVSRDHGTDKPRFFFLDEGSLASTRQMHQFYRKLRPQDRVLLIGDDSPTRPVGQHVSVEAGRIFRELQESGVPTAQLNRILRQKEPWLLDVVKHLNAGRTVEAVESLDREGKIEEFLTPQVRYRVIALAYARQPENTLVVSPDNKSRQEINAEIRTVLKARGMLTNPRDVYVLQSRDLTRADLTLAVNYRLYDSVQYLSGSNARRLKSKEYVTVIDVDRTRNLLTVATGDGRRFTYDPEKELSHATVYEEKKLEIAVGDRVQMTAPFKEKALRTRETGTVRSFDGKEISVALDNGKTATWALPQFRHLDYSYAMTSHAAQSMTVDRALVHVNTGDSRLRALHNSTFSYVAQSRPQYDLQLFTDDKAALVRELSRTMEKHTALSHEQVVETALAMSA